MRFVLLAWFTLALTASGHARIEIGWPTPNTAFLEGKPVEAFIQPTASGEPESGCFGCVRSNGFQFHEGLDLKPVKRDVTGEPADKIFAAMDGVVRHINNSAGDSNYGRYIVIEHPDMVPAVYTLYAHLRSVQPGLRVGMTVKRGEVIALMGRSAGGGGIPKDRAHMHFEIGLMITRDFQSWYNFKKFGSPNEHGVWNGMNLMGLDPLDFFRKFRAKEVNDFQEYFDRMRPAVTLRIATSRVPDFIQRYPSLLKKTMPLGPIAGWEIDFNWTGLPVAWRPLGPGEIFSASSQITFVNVDEEIVRAHHCKSLVRVGHGVKYPGKDLEIVLQQLFGLR